jgi:hypothetical protein
MITKLGYLMAGWLMLAFFFTAVFSGGSSDWGLCAILGICATNLIYFCAGVYLPWDKM